MELYFIHNVFFNIICQDSESASVLNKSDYSIIPTNFLKVVEITGVSTITTETIIPKKYIKSLCCTSKEIHNFVEFDVVSEITEMDSNEKIYADAKELYSVKLQEFKGYTHIIVADYDFLTKTEAGRLIYDVGISEGNPREVLYQEGNPLPQKVKTWFNIKAEMETLLSTEPYKSYLTIDKISNYLLNNIIETSVKLV